MKLHVPRNLARKLAGDLKRAGAREIGGVLVGEALGRDEFRIADLSIQKTGGGVACFVRDPAEHLPFLNAFFERTGRDYSRFNYLGEWHSHPSFVPVPSGPDVRAMQNIVLDPSTGATFAVLLIVRLASNGALALSATEFQSDRPPAAVELVLPRVRGFPLLATFAGCKKILPGRPPRRS